MFNLFFLLLGLTNLLYVSGIKSHHPKHNVTYDYILVNEGATEYNIKNNNEFYKFSTGLNSKYILTNTTSIYKCKEICSRLDECLGLFVYTINTENYTCNVLSNLGDVAKTDLNSYSYKKVHHYTNNDMYSLMGYVIDTNYFTFYYNNKTIETIVYLDLNFNRRYDIEEPITMTNNLLFKFNNLQPGRYLIRELLYDEDCYQLYPSKYSKILNNKYFLENSIKINTGNGYIDNIVYYYNNGHHTLSGIQGGKINDKELKYEISLNDILKNNDKYITFYPDDSIIVSFSDETIIDDDGYELIVTTYDYSKTKAHVSVSYDNIDYHLVGVLDYNNNTFDLKDINYTQHLVYVKLHFFGDNKDEGLNIVNIRGKINSIEYPTDGFYIQIPNNNSLSYIYFINDCHYHYDCYTRCYYTSETYDISDSCMVGCDLIDDNNMANYSCENYELSKIPFLGKIFNLNSCKLGYHYAIDKLLFPDYKVYQNSTSIDSDIINNKDEDVQTYNFDSIHEYLYHISSHCYNESDCKAFSFNTNNNSNNHFFSDYKKLYKPDSYLIVKNKHLGDNELNYLTATSTTNTDTETSTTTNTETSTTTNTDTSITTNTETSTTTNTETSTTTNTETSTTTNTDTSITTNTDTSITTNTETSTTTSTVTDIEINTTSNITTSNKTTSNITMTTLNSNFTTKASGVKNEDTLKFKIILSLASFVFILGFLVIAYFCLCHNPKKVYSNERVITSFSNPVYLQQGAYNNNDPVYTNTNTNTYINTYDNTQDNMYDVNNLYREEVDYLEINDA